MNPIRPILLALALVCVGANAEEELNEGQLAPARVDFGDDERRAVGRLLCDGPLETLDEGRVGCGRCPAFTGEPGGSGPFVINNLIRGGFTAAGKQELLLDTDGCEAHFAAFGGAVLLRHGDDGVWRRLYYQPGVRLDDCLATDGERERTLLVCNETELAQGALWGQISVIEVDARAIGRWRLLQWLDNSGAETRRLVRIVPLDARFRVDAAGGATGLELRLRRQLVRFPDDAGNLDEALARGLRLPPPETLKLLFNRHGRRLLAAPASQPALGALSRVLAQE